MPCWSFDECRAQLLRSVDRPEVPSILWLLQNHLFVSAQDVDDGDFALDQGQVLPDAVPEARAEGEIGEGVQFGRVEVVPPVRVECLWVLEEGLVELGWHDAEWNHNPLSNGYFAQIVISGCLPLEHTRGRSIHSKYLSLYLFQVLELFQFVIGDVLDVIG